MTDRSEQNKDFKKLAEEHKENEDERERLSKRAMNKENRKLMDKLQNRRLAHNVDLLEYAYKHKVDYDKAKKQLDMIVGGGLVHTLKGDVV